MPTLSADVLSQYCRFSLYNSPYVAHDSGRAIDLYPIAENTAPSPVAGTVLDVRTVHAPPKAYAAPYDYLLLIDTGERIARLLHVDPVVEPGDTVAVGDSLGTLVRAGFFAPWVDNHIHLGFRDPETNPYRASGSLPIDVDVSIEPLPWEGTGRVSSVHDTYAVLDAPPHPAPDTHTQFVGIKADSSATATEGVLDGGCPHYDGGGFLVCDGSRSLSPARNAGTAGSAIELTEARIGSVEGRDVRWDDIEIRANDTPITGLSFFIAQDAFGVKLICPDVAIAQDEHIEVTVHPV